MVIKSVGGRNYLDCLVCIVGILVVVKHFYKGNGKGNCEPILEQLLFAMGSKYILGGRWLIKT